MNIQNSINLLLQISYYLSADAGHWWCCVVIAVKRGDDDCGVDAWISNWVKVTSVNRYHCTTAVLVIKSFIYSFLHSLLLITPLGSIYSKQQNSAKSHQRYSDVETVGVLCLKNQRITVLTLKDGCVVWYRQRRGYGGSQRWNWCQSATRQLLRVQSPDVVLPHSLAVLLRTPCSRRYCKHDENVATGWSKKTGPLYIFPNI